MSVQRLELIFGDLPLNLRDPILGYAISVKEAFPAICRQAGIEREQSLEDDLVLIAGIKKFHAIVFSTFSTLNKALRYLAQSDVPSVRVAGREYSFDSSEYRRLRQTWETLRHIIEEEDLVFVIDEYDYAQILRTIADERRQA